MKALCLNKLCSKFEVDMKKIDCIYGVIPQTATGCRQTPFNFFDEFLCQYYSDPPNMESWESDLSDNMYFVKIIKSYDSKRP